tara:strand:+ start:201 stop:1223 length:1023 start_codon:yes stop_codon:yes gene_type:complete
MRYILIILFFSLSVSAQDGGNNIFSFINIEYSPRASALGGNSIAIYDNDISLSLTTPSLLNSSMHNELVFMFGDYFSDIKLFSFAYAIDLKNIGVVGFSAKAISYGIFRRTDHSGYSHGNFTASDQIITFGIGKKFNDKLSVGANINLLNSIYDIYNAFGLSSNISSTYFNSDKRLSSTLLIKNIGRQVNNYSSSQEDLPFEIQFAISKELAHLPFRYHLSYNDIMNFNIQSPYKLTLQTNIETGELEIKEESIAKTALRHIIIGGELNPFRKSLFVRGGFNFQRRFDLTVLSKPVMVGFSWGIGFRVSRYYFDFSRSSFHLSGNPNNFSISTNLSSFGF